MRFPNQTRPLLLSDVLRRIQEVVSVRLHTVAKEMVRLDYANINAISKEDFRNICDRHFMRLTDDQVILSESTPTVYLNMAKNAFNFFSFETCGKRYQSTALEI